VEPSWATPFILEGLAGARARSLRVEIFDHDKASANDSLGLFVCELGGAAGLDEGLPPFALVRSRLHGESL
jgi:hypothetical protein